MGDFDVASEIVSAAAQRIGDPVWHTKAETAEEKLGLANDRSTKMHSLPETADAEYVMSARVTDPRVLAIMWTRTVLGAIAVLLLLGLWYRQQAFVRERAERLDRIINAGCTTLAGDEKDAKAACVLTYSTRPGSASSPTDDNR